MRLIDADELISYLNSVAGCFDSTREVEDNTIEAIEIAPTVDAVPVVRCKDCSFRYTKMCFSKHETGDMDFCSCGQEKEIGK